MVETWVDLESWWPSKGLGPDAADIELDSPAEATKEGSQETRAGPIRAADTVDGQNSSTPRLFDPSPVNGLLSRFRPIWVCRGVGMAIFAFGMLSTV